MLDPRSSFIPSGFFSDEKRGNMEQSPPHHTPNKKRGLFKNQRMRTAMKKGRSMPRRSPRGESASTHSEIMPVAGSDYRRGKPCPPPTPSCPLESRTQVTHVEERTTSHAFWFPCVNLLYFSATALWRAKPVLTSDDSAHSNVLLAHLSIVHQFASKRGRVKAPPQTNQ